MIKSTFTSELVERSARSARDRLSQKRTQLRKAEVRYAQASINRSKQEELLAQAMGALIEAKKSEGRRKVRCEELQRRYAEIYAFYNEILHEGGLTEAEISRYFGDLEPATFNEKKATA